jgi:O-Antigen ligase/Tetratricopeptide repeat
VDTAAAGLSQPPLSRTDTFVAAIDRGILPVGAAVAVGALLAANGGFFPVSWSWATLALLWACALGLVLRAPARPSRLELAFLAAVALVTAWTFVSAAWTTDVTQTVWEGERTLVLVAALGAGLALAHRHAVRSLLGGTLAGITAISLYALATRLFPAHVGHYDPLAVYRLSTPVGYWNGLGIVAAMGALLALAFSTRARTRTGSALAGLALPVLLLTVYFTYSRGSWIALAAGLVVLLALDPGRLATAAGILALAPAPALTVWLASREHALTTQRSILAAAKHDGHRIALVLLVLALAEAGIAVALVAARRLEAPRALRLGWAALLVAALLAAAGVAVAHYGSPSRIAHRAYHDFTAPPPAHVSNLNTRIFNLSNDGRIQLWKVAWRQADAHLLAGDGAGSYERYYLQHRKTTQNVENAHSLYLETLATLGVVGLALLALALAIPLAAAVRFRRRRLVPFACAAYCAFLVHASIDWDWQLAGVALAAVLCGLACVVAGRRDGGSELPMRWRGAGAAVAVGLSALTIVGLLGNTALESSQSATSSGHAQSAERHAHSAIRWMPWSAAGWQALGEAQLRAHDLAGARASLDRAVAKDPNDWVLWLDLVAATHGDEQVSAVRHALRLDPLDPDLATYLAGITG